MGRGSTRCRRRPSRGAGAGRRSRRRRRRLLAMPLELGFHLPLLHSLGGAAECLEVAEEVGWEAWEEWELDVVEWEGEEVNGTGSGLELQVPGLAPPLRP